MVSAVEAILVGELTGEVVIGALRVVASVLLDIAGELLIKGPGYLICRVFTRNVDPDGGAAVLSGLVFWLIIGIIVSAIVKHAHDPVDCIRSSAA